MRDLAAALRNLPAAQHGNDWDPIHMPGFVQAYGALVVAEPQSRRVTFVSENVSDLFGVEPGKVLDRSYLQLFDHEDQRRAVEAAIRPETIMFPNPVRMSLNGRTCDAIFHSHAGATMIEIEPVGENDGDYDEMATHAVSELFNPGSVEELCQRAVDVVRQTTGFDRVLLYRFDPRANGQVIAESRREGVDGFLGLFFPSADIPARSRDLYLKNFTRYIPNLGGKSYNLAGVYPGGGRASSAHPVDMSFANVRGVVPCHAVYLQNMGVEASMSFSINVDGKLWGLFACHHHQPRHISFDRRVVCEQSAMMFIFKLSSMTSKAARSELRRDMVGRLKSTISIGATLSRRLNALRGDWAGSDAQSAETMARRALAAINNEVAWLLPPDSAALLAQPGDAVAATPEVNATQRLLLDLVDADSAAVVRNGAIHRIGNAPPELALFAITSLFGRELPDIVGTEPQVFATDALSSFVPAAEAIKDTAAGIMAVALSSSTASYLLWFRREMVVEATWAGNPSERGKVAADSQNPRASFEAWKRDIHNMSRAWEIEDVQIADELGQVLRAIEQQGAPARPAAAAAPGGRPFATSLRVAESLPQAGAGGGGGGPTRRVVRISRY